MKKYLVGIALLFVFIPSQVLAQSFIRYYPPAGGGALSYPLNGGGTGCATPAFSFTADTDAGLCLAAANSLALQTNATATSGTHLALGDDSGSYFYGYSGGSANGIAILPLVPSVSIVAGDTVQLKIGTSLGTGFLSAQGSSAALTRSLTSGDGSIVIVNPAGTAGNPDLSVDNSVFSRYSSGTGNVPATGAVGTFYFETDRPAAYTYPTTDAETVLLSLPAGTGVSGGVPYFTATADVIGSSAALTVNLPVIGGGAGAAPTVGTRSGNTTAYVTTTGAQTSGDCVKIDANGNHIANGSACGGGTPAFDSTRYELFEDFDTGYINAGQIGRTGFNVTNVASGTITVTTDGDANHPGLLRLSSHVSNDNSGNIITPALGTTITGTIWNAHDWTIEVLVKIGSNSTAITSTAVYFGLDNLYNTLPGTSVSKAAWIRRDTDLSDTAFVFQVCDNSGSAGCGAAGDDTNSKTVLSTKTPVAGDFCKLKIRMATSGVGGNPTLYMSVGINNGAQETEKTFCSSGCDDTLATDPTGTAMTPIISYVTRTTTGVMSGDLDYMYALVTGLSR